MRLFSSYPGKGGCSGDFLFPCCSVPRFCWFSPFSLFWGFFGYPYLPFLFSPARVLCGEFLPLSFCSRAVVSFRPVTGGLLRPFFLLSILSLTFIEIFCSWRFSLGQLLGQPPPLFPQSWFSLSGFAGGGSSPRGKAGDFSFSPNILPYLGFGSWCCPCSLALRVLRVWRLGRSCLDSFVSRGLPSNRGGVDASSLGGRLVAGGCSYCS